MAEPPKSSPSLVQTQTPGRRGYNVSIWGGTANPFGQCPRYGGCPDVSVVAAEVQERLSENPPSIERDARTVESLLQQSFATRPNAQGLLQMFDRLTGERINITDRDTKNRIQNVVNELIDGTRNTLQGRPPVSDYQGLRDRYEAFRDIGRLVENLDRSGVQGRDLSFSRLNTYAAAFSQDSLQAGLEYRDALVARLRNRPPGSNPEQDRQDFRQLTERLGALSPERRQEFQTYQDQVLRSLTPGAGPPGP